MSESETAGRERPSRLAAIADAAENAGGQAIWAAGQMAVLILLSHEGLQRLIGVYSVGLGVFAVATLLLGLNLRVAVSTDRAHAIGFTPAMTARAIACLVALPLAAGSMALMRPSSEELLIAVLLVAARIPDQISEVILGFFLRDGHRRKISRSFLVRGIMAVGVVALAWLLDWSMLAMAAAMLPAVSVATLAADLAPEAVRQSGKAAGSLKSLLQSTWRISPYPALDSLHLNSLRFALVMVTGPAFYGLVAIAQVLYTPFQILMAALGFGYLDTARQLHDEGDDTMLRRHVGLGLLLGGAISAGFVLTCLLLPDVLLRLLFADKAGEAAGPLLVTAVAIGLAPLSGFLSHVIVSGSRLRSYLSAPLVGLGVVWGGMGLLMLGGAARWPDRYEAALAVAALFAVSFAARLAVSLWGLGTAARGGQP